MEWGLKMSLKFGPFSVKRELVEGGFTGSLSTNYLSKKARQKQLGVNIIHAKVVSMSCCLSLELKISRRPLFIKFWFNFVYFWFYFSVFLSYSVEKWSFL